MLTDIFGPRKAEEIGEDIGLFMEQLKVLGWRDMRPWNEFASSFKPPSWDYRSIEQRVTANFLHFRTNYLAIIAAIFTIRIIFAPVLFLCIVLCAGATIAVIAIIKEPIVVGDYTLDEKAKLTTCGGVSFVFLGLCGALEHLLWGLLIALTLCICHMMLRPRSVTSTANMYASEAKLSANAWASSTSTDTDRHDDPEAPAGSNSSEASTGGIYQAGLTSATIRKRN